LCIFAQLHVYRLKKILTSESKFHPPSQNTI
jgi:hypothetical protein